MKVLITGGAGFLGGYIAHELQARGYKVVITDIDDSNADEIIDDMGPEEPIWFSKVDVTDPEGMRKLLAELEIEEVIHLAGISHTVAAALGQRAAWMPGTVGLATIHDAIADNKALGVNKVRRVSISSSSLLSGMFQENEKGKVANDEQRILLSDCYHQYVDNKLGMEMICHDNWYQFEVPFSIFRFGTQYGPRMRRNIVTWYFVRNVLLGRPMVIHGDGTQQRQHFYCEDLARGVATIIDNFDVFKNRTVSIVPEHMTSVNEIADAITEVVPGAEKRYVESRTIDARVKQIEQSLELTAAGWLPEVGLIEGLEKTVEYYRKRMELVTAGFDERVKEGN